MTIQQLQYILEVHRTGSISKAANNLYLAQPNLSNAIRSLEQELGFPVFIRSNKGIRPTEQGFLVLEEAGQMLESYERMLRTVEQTLAVRCRIGGTSYAPVCEAYIQLCTEYEGQEELDFSYTTLPFSDALEKLYLSMLDVAITIARPAGHSEVLKMAESRGITVERIGLVPVVLRIGPKHPLYSEPEIRLSDFHNYTFVDYTGNPFLQDEELRTLLQINMDRIVRVDDRSSKSRLVANSQMYSVGCKLPPRLNQRYGFRNIPLGDIHFLILALTRKKQKPTPEAQRYLELLRDELANL